MFLRQRQRLNPHRFPTEGHDLSAADTASSGELADRGKTSSTETLTSTPTRLESGYGAAAVCGILAGPIMVAASLAAALAQPHDFSLINHPASDLGAATANQPWIANQLGSNLPGLLVLVFAVALWRALGRHRSARIGTSLIVAAGIGLFLTGIFTLDCPTIDTKCPRMDDPSPQANIHLIVGLITFLAFASAPFVVARAVKSTTAWRDLRAPSLTLGVLTIVGTLTTAAIGPGLGDLTLAILWFSWITVLSIRMWRLTQQSHQLSSWGAVGAR